MNQTISFLKTTIPVTIITGFLGSGKTTLLNHILSQQHNLKTAVLVNEFGEIGIDNELIIATEDNVVELNNGCICCTINKDLVKAVDKILNRPQKVDYLIVETTGIADPLPVALTFFGNNLREQTRLDSIITLADCENFSLDRFEHSEAAISQLACADVVLLNKIDLVEECLVDTIEKRIKGLREGIRVLRTTKAQVDLPLILSVGLFQSDRYFQPEEITRESDDKHQHHQHSAHLDNDHFISFSFESNRPLNIHKFQYFLDNQLPDNVFRAKGFLWFQESPFRQIFHLSGKRHTITDHQWQEEPKNQLVIIGQNLNTEELKRFLEACIS